MLKKSPLVSYMNTQPGRISLCLQIWMWWLSDDDFQQNIFPNPLILLLLEWKCTEKFITLSVAEKSFTKHNFCKFEISFWFNSWQSYSTRVKWKKINKPMIEKSSQNNLWSRELLIGERVAYRILMNGLIRVGRTVTDLVIPNGISARYPGKLYDSTIRVDALHQVRWYRERIIFPVLCI